MGMTPGKPVAIVSQSALRVAMMVYTALYCANPLLPLNPHRRGLAELMEDAGVSLAFTDAGLEGLIPHELLVRPAAVLDEDTAPPRGPDPRPASLQGVQLVIATSGTSGAPRGVMLTGANLAAAVRIARRHLRLAAGDAWLACLPLFHISGLSILLRCLETGATVILHDRFDPDQVYEDLNRYRVTHLSLVPAMLSRVLDCAAHTPPPSLRHVLIGGGPLCGALAERARVANWPICPTYGLSETTAQIATLLAVTEGWQPGDVGKPLAGIRVEIVGDEARPTPDPGRIRIAGPVVMAGYANKQGVKGLGLDGDRYLSNDIGVFDDRGHLHVLGRADEVLISGGVNIHPQEVEDQLLACPGVDEAAVTALSDAIWGHRLVALVRGPIDEPSLRAWCDIHLASTHRPQAYLKVEALPRNALGKLDRQALRNWVKQAI